MADFERWLQSRLTAHGFPGAMLAVTGLSAEETS
jgi:hypothetical protein